MRVENLADVFDLGGGRGDFGLAVVTEVEVLHVGVVVVVGLRERDGRRRPRPGGGWRVSWQRGDVEIGDEGGNEEVLEGQRLLGLLDACRCLGEGGRHGTLCSGLAVLQRRRESFDDVGSSRRCGEGHLIRGIGCAELGSLPPKEGFLRPVLVDKVMALGMGPLGQQGWRRSWLWRMAGLVGRALRAALCFRGSRRLRQLDLIDLERACHLE